MNLNECYRPETHKSDIACNIPMSSTSPTSQPAMATGPVDSSTSPTNCDNNILQQILAKVNVIPNLEGKMNSMSIRLEKVESELSSIITSLQSAHQEISVLTEKKH